MPKTEAAPKTVKFRKNYDIDAGHVQEARIGKQVVANIYLSPQSDWYWRRQGDYPDAQGCVYAYNSMHFTNASREELGVKREIAHYFGAVLEEKE